VRRAVAGLALLGLSAVIGGAALQSGARREGESAGARPLELVPASPGFLRVLATPWAEVWIDGERIDVTPFARAIPLSAGTHYVTLVHPSAPPEKRAISVEAGQTRTLDVVMPVPDIAPREDVAAQPLGPTAEKPR
jgi:serine/threonine-protein kinase